MSPYTRSPAIAGSDKRGSIVPDCGSLWQRPHCASTRGVVCRCRLAASLADAPPLPPPPLPPPPSSSVSPPSSLSPRPPPPAATLPALLVSPDLCTFSVLCPFHLPPFALAAPPPPFHLLVFWNPFFVSREYVVCYRHQSRCIPYAINRRA